MHNAENLGPFLQHVLGIEQMRAAFGGSATAVRQRSLRSDEALWWRPTFCPAGSASANWTENKLQPQKQGTGNAVNPSKQM